jgi:hypothetical protein
VEEDDHHQQVVGRPDGDESPRRRGPAGDQEHGEQHDRGQHDEVVQDDQRGMAPRGHGFLDHQDELQAVRADQVEQVAPGLLEECSGLARDPAQSHPQRHVALLGQRRLRADERLLASPPLALHERVVVVQVVDAVGLHGDEVARHDRVADRPGHDGGRRRGTDPDRTHQGRAIAPDPPAPQARQRHERGGHRTRERGEPQQQASRGGPPPAALLRRLRDQHHDPGQQEHVADVLGERGRALLDGMEVHGVGDARPGAARSGHAPSEVAGEDRGQRIEADLDELDGQEVGTEHRHDPGQEEVVQRGDRPRTQPQVPGIARPHEAPGIRTLEDGERAVKVVVGMRVEEGLVRPEQEQGAGGHGQQRGSRPPWNAAGGPREHGHRGGDAIMPAWKC